MTWVSASLVSLIVSGTVGLLDRHLDQPPASKPRVAVRSAYAGIEVFPIEAGPDGTLILRLTVSPDPTIHVYAPGPTGSTGPALTFSPESGIQPIGVDLPPGETFVSSATGDEILAYRQPFTMAQHVRVRGTSAAGGPRHVSAVLRYQACTDRVCFKPERIRLDWERPGQRPPAGPLHTR